MIKPKKKSLKVVGISIKAYQIPTEEEPRVIVKKTGGKPKLLKKKK